MLFCIVFLREGEREVHSIILLLALLNSIFIFTFTILLLFTFILYFYVIVCFDFIQLSFFYLVLYICMYVCMYELSSNVLYFSHKREFYIYIKLIRG